MQSLIIWLIFFLFIQTKPSFCHMFAWSQLDCSAIPVSISAVSLTGRQTWQNVNSQRRCKSSCFCLCSFCFWEEVLITFILNDNGRNFLLGSSKKICSQMFFEDFYLLLYLPLWVCLIRNQIITPLFLNEDFSKGTEKLKPPNSFVWTQNRI